MKAIKTGIIGLGMMGFSQIKNCFGVLKQYDVVAVSDPYEPHLQRAKEYFASIGKQVKTYSNYEDMLKLEDFELAVIVTPDYLHEEMTVNCLKAGKHVRLEKPMATTIEGCKHIIDVWKEHPQVVQVGFELRYSYIVSKMRKEINNLGKVKMMWCHEFRHPFLKKVGDTPDWITQKKYTGGTLLEKNCHHFDLFNMFADSKPISIYASGDNQVEYYDKDILDNAFVTVDYENGMRTMLSLCMFAPEQKGQKHMHSLEFGIIGDKGRMEMLDDELYIWDRGAKSEQSYQYLRSNFEAHTEDIIPSLIDLAQCINEKNQPDTDIFVGLRSTLLALAAEKSAEEKRIITIEEMEKTYGIEYR